MSTGVSLGGLAAHLVPARELEAREKRGRAGTGVGGLDRMLDGGWPRGAVSELWGARGQGRTAVLLASLAAALRREESVALVDLGGTFDPRTAWRVGVPLERLLWVRAFDDSGTLKGSRAPRRGSRLALAAAEAIVAAGGFGLVVLDFGERAPPVPTAAWLRLRRSSAAPGTVVLVVSPRPLQGVMSAAAVSVRGARIHFGSAGRRAAAEPALLTAVESRIVNEGDRSTTFLLVHAL